MRTVAGLRSSACWNRARSVFGVGEKVTHPNRSAPRLKALAPLLHPWMLLKHVVGRLLEHPPGGFGTDEECVEHGTGNHAIPCRHRLVMVSPQRFPKPSPGRAAVDPCPGTAHGRICALPPVCEGCPQAQGVQEPVGRQPVTMQCVTVGVLWVNFEAARTETSPPQRESHCPVAGKRFNGIAGWLASDGPRHQPHQPEKDPRRPQVNQPAQHIHASRVRRRGPSFLPSRRGARNRTCRHGRRARWAVRHLEHALRACSCRDMNKFRHPTGTLFMS